MTKVLICDDEHSRSIGWKKQIDKLQIDEVEVFAVEPTDIQEGIKSLEIRRHMLRNKTSGTRPPCIFDAADVLVLDFDLFGLENTSRFTTGEEVAYLARLYSTAKIIVILNEFGINRFDLTLTEDVETKSDLNIGSDQLCNPGLWKESAFNGFRPWHWPSLLNEVKLFDERASDARNHLASPLLSFLGFQDENTLSLTRSAISGLTKNSARDEKSMTLKDFVLETGVFVTLKDASLGEWSDDDIARIAASSLHKWLERKVLVSQDVLVDLPHLIARLPWLVPGDTSSLEQWNLQINGGNVETLARLQKHLYPRNGWLSRPAFWWQQIASDDELMSPPDNWDFETIPDFVFREDLSNFGLRSDSQEFVADISGTYDIRYICNPSAINADGFADPNKVSYSPAIRLSM